MYTEVLYHIIIVSKLYISSYIHIYTLPFTVSSRIVKRPTANSPWKNSRLGVKNTNSHVTSLRQRIPGRLLSSALFHDRSQKVLGSGLEPQKLTQYSSSWTWLHHEKPILSASTIPYIMYWQTKINLCQYMTSTEYTGKACVNYTGTEQWLKHGVRTQYTGRIFVWKILSGHIMMAGSQSKQMILAQQAVSYCKLSALLYQTLHSWWGQARRRHGDTVQLQMFVCIEEISLRLVQCLKHTVRTQCTGRIWNSVWNILSGHNILAGGLLGSPATGWSRLIEACAIAYVPIGVNDTGIEHWLKYTRLAPWHGRGIM